MAKYKILSLSALAGVCCRGCQPLGPKVINETHPAYNCAMGSVIDRQMLSNLVRLRYRENPTFLDISSITEGREDGMDFGFDKNEMTWESPRLDNGPNVTRVGGKNSLMFGPKAMVGIKQKPTISYKPLRGKEFIKQLMTPIPLNAVLGLSRSGWKIERVFNTCVERINDVENAPNASGPTPWNKPEYEAFYSVTAILKRLEERRCVSIGRDPGDGKKLVLSFKEDSSCREDIRELKNILGIDSNKNEYCFSTNFLKRQGDVIAVQTRSLMGVLFYLSHAVEVPEEDVSNGFVQVTVDKSGEVFDWTANASGTLLKVHCSDKRPEHAYVSTRYRGHWFYINDNDLHSKSTFMFISTLFNLQAGEASSADIAPTLTIPVN